MNRDVVDALARAITQLDSRLRKLANVDRPTGGGTAVHTHADAPNGGQLDWDTALSDASHSHQSAAEGGALDGAAITTGITGSGNVVKATGPSVTTLAVPSGGIVVTDGQVTITNSLTGGDVKIDGPAGTNRTIEFQTGGVPRWYFFVDTGAETGGNAGSMLRCISANDAGSSNFTPMEASRIDGKVQFNHGLIVLGTVALPAGGLDGAALTDGTVTAAKSANRTRNFRMEFTMRNTGLAAADVVGSDGTYGIPVFKLADSSLNFVTGVAPLPEDYVAAGQLTVRIRWWAESATSGNVRLRGNVGYARSGVIPSGNALADIAVATFAVSGTADRVEEFVMTTTTAPAAGDQIKVGFVREGSDGADTATGDINVSAAVEIEYTADS